MEKRKNKGRKIVLLVCGILLALAVIAGGAAAVQDRLQKNARQDLKSAYLHRNRAEAPGKNVRSAEINRERTFFLAYCFKTLYNKSVICRVET